MDREFINTSLFDKARHELGFDDSDFADLQDRLSRNPSLGNVIVGASGARKLRWTSITKERVAV